ILQPTLRPGESRVQPLLFYGYDPQVRARQRISGHAKCVDIMHVGHNWWRWREVNERLLPAIERVRGSLGEICFVGLWGGAPSRRPLRRRKEKAYPPPPATFWDTGAPFPPASTLSRGHSDDEFGAH